MLLSNRFHVKGIQSFNFNEKPASNKAVNPAQTAEVVIFAKVSQCAQSSIIVLVLESWVKYLIKSQIPKLCLFCLILEHLKKDLGEISELWLLYSNRTTAEGKLYPGVRLQAGLITAQSFNW